MKKAAVETAFRCREFEGGCAKRAGGWYLLIGQDVAGEVFGEGKLQRLD
jgi:hypothetical protein